MIAFLLKHWNSMILILLLLCLNCIKKSIRFLKIRKWIHPCVSWGWITLIQMRISNSLISTRRISYENIVLSKLILWRRLVTEIWMIAHRLLVWFKSFEWKIIYWFEHTSRPVLILRLVSSFRNRGFKGSIMMFNRLYVIDS